jgi:hypothetical protein
VRVDLANPCTWRCEQAVVADPARGEPLRFALAADGAPLAAVLWGDGQAHPLTKPVTIIGRRRETADVPLDDASVSRRAAVLRVCPHGVTLEDFGAGTSVLINDQRAGDGARVFTRDEIRIGRFVVRLAAT